MAHGPAYAALRQVAGLFTGDELGNEGWNQLVRIARYVRKNEPKPTKRRRKSAMDIAADACGLVKVRGASAAPITSKSRHQILLKRTQ